MFIKGARKRRNVRRQRERGGREEEGEGERDKDHELNKLYQLFEGWGTAVHETLPTPTTTNSSGDE